MSPKVQQVVKVRPGLEPPSKKSQNPRLIFDSVFQHCGFILWSGVTFLGVTFLDGSEKNILSDKQEN